MAMILLKINLFFRQILINILIQKMSAIINQVDDDTLKNLVENASDYAGANGIVMIAPDIQNEKVFLIINKKLFILFNAKVQMISQIAVVAMKKQYKQKIMTIF